MASLLQGKILIRKQRFCLDQLLIENMNRLMIHWWAWMQWMSFKLREVVFYWKYVLNRYIKQVTVWSTFFKAGALKTSLNASRFDQIITVNSCVCLSLGDVGLNTDELRAYRSSPSAMVGVKKGSVCRYFSAKCGDRKLKKWEVPAHTTL